MKRAWVSMLPSPHSFWTLQMTPHRFVVQTCALARRSLVPFLILAAVHASCAAQATQRYAALSASSRDVATRYFAAYVQQDWARLEPLLAETASFQDPTATHIFGAQRHLGKAAMMKLFRENYASITSMRFKPLREYSAGEYTVISGDLAWTMKLKRGQEVSTVMPLTTIVRVENGLVTEHQDLADYQFLLDAMARVQP